MSQLNQWERLPAQPIAKSGFVSIVGPTNAGKSTLLNRLLGEKVSIVSHKTQTTWHGIRGILEDGDAQIIFIDTPGFQKHQEAVARLLNRVADQAARECEQHVWAFDVSNRNALLQLRHLQERIGGMGTKESRLVVLNKVDTVSKPEVLPLIAAFHETGLFREIIPISARSGTNLRPLIDSIKAGLAVGGALYEPNTVTDRTKNFRIAELVREKVYRYTHAEVPYCVWVEVEDVPEEHQTSKTPMFHVTLHVDAASRRGILIGKGGEKLKAIGTAARRDVEKLVGEQVCLKLFVDVDSDWKQNARRLDSYLELR